MDHDYSDHMDWSLDHSTQVIYAPPTPFRTIPSPKRSFEEYAEDDSIEAEIERARARGFTTDGVDRSGFEFSQAYRTSIPQITSISRNQQYPINMGQPYYTVGHHADSMHMSAMPQPFNDIQPLEAETTPWALWFLRGCTIAAYHAFNLTLVSSYKLGRGIQKTGRLARRNKHHVIETYRASAQVARSVKRRLVEFYVHRNPIEQPRHHRTPSPSPARSPRPRRRTPPHMTSARIAWDEERERESQLKAMSPIPSDHLQSTSVNQLDGLISSDEDTVVDDPVSVADVVSSPANTELGVAEDTEVVRSPLSEITNNSLLSEMRGNSPLSVGTPTPNPRKKRKSVRFYEDPTTGGPVSRFKILSSSPLGSSILRSSPARSNEENLPIDSPSSSNEETSFQITKIDGEDLASGRMNHSIQLASPGDQIVKYESEPVQCRAQTEEHGERALKLEEQATKDEKDPEPEGDSSGAEKEIIKPGKDEKQSDECVEQIIEHNKECKSTSAAQILVGEEVKSESPLVAPSTPLHLTADLGRLDVSGRRISVRRKVKELEEEKKQAEEKARKEAEEAAEKARKASEDEEKRKKQGVRRIPKVKAIQPLSEEWEAKVTKAMAAGEAHELATTSTGTKLTRKDFGTVLPQWGRDRAHGWLNDEIVAGYLQTVVDFALRKDGHKRGHIPKYHAFNTFFYSNLRDKGPDSIKRWAGRAKIGGKNLLQAEYVFIPVHEHNHWTLLVVSPVRKTIEYFDSLGGSPKPYIANTKAWLKQELGSGAWNEDEWTVSKQTRGPRQNNGMDCGVFASTTAKMVMLGVDPVAAYGAADIPTQRMRMVAELMNGGFTGEFEPAI
ncbi:Smt3-specific protease [Lignoscripta atroalba]|nr:Smt3-specific protease [Lignoscripta atroalba]